VEGNVHQSKETPTSKGGSKDFSNPANTFLTKPLRIDTIDVK
jgi:hypothetical protein